MISRDVVDSVTVTVVAPLNPAGIMPCTADPQALSTTIVIVPGLMLMNEYFPLESVVVLADPPDGLCHPMDTPATTIPEDVRNVPEIVISEVAVFSCGRSSRR